MAETHKYQISLRATIVLMAVIAFWFGIFREASPAEMLVFSGAALTAGTVGHVAYTYWLPWRFTVIATVLLVYNFALTGLLLLQAGSGVQLSDCLDLLLGVVVQPAEMAINARGAHGKLFSGAVVLGTILLSPAHVIRPCLITALITAIGLGIWYAAGMLIMIHAG